MGSIFLKGLWDRRNNYFIVVLCGVFQVSITFAVSALWEYLSLMVNGRLSKFLDITVMSEMFFLTYELLLFLMILVFLSYIRKRASDYAVLESLGMKKKHKYMFIAWEYGGSFYTLPGNRGFAGHVVLRPFEIWFIESIFGSGG